MTPRRRAIRLIREIAKLPPEEQFWVAQSFLTGCVPPADEMKHERNVLLRRYREEWHSGLSNLAAAEKIAAEVGTYRAGAWREHQHSKSTPVEIKGTRRGDLFKILKKGNVPALEMLKKILALVMIFGISITQIWLHLLLVAPA